MSKTVAVLLTSGVVALACISGVYLYIHSKPNIEWTSTDSSPSKDGSPAEDNTIVLNGSIRLGIRGDSNEPSELWINDKKILENDFISIPKILPSSGVGHVAIVESQCSGSSCTYVSRYLVSAGRDGKPILSELPSALSDTTPINIKYWENGNDFRLELTEASELSAAGDPIVNSYIYNSGASFFISKKADSKYAQFATGGYPNDILSDPKARTAIFHFADTELGKLREEMPFQAPIALEEGNVGIMCGWRKPIERASPDDGVAIVIDLNSGQYEVWDRENDQLERRPGITGHQLPARIIDIAERANCGFTFHKMHIDPVPTKAAPPSARDKQGAENVVDKVTPDSTMMPTNPPAETGSSNSAGFDELKKTSTMKCIGKEKTTTWMLDGDLLYLDGSPVNLPNAAAGTVERRGDQVEYTGLIGEKWFLDFENKRALMDFAGIKGEATCF